MRKHALLMATALAGLVITSAQAEDLHNAMAKAYQYSPRLKSEQATLASTDELVSQAVSGFRPNISAQYERGREETQVGNAAETSRNPETRELTIVQPLFSGLETVYRVKSAESQVMAAQQTLVNTEQNILYSAVSAFMDVVRDHRELALNKNNEAVLQKQLQATQDRFSVGEVTKTDVSQSESRYARAVAERIRAEGRLASSIATYKRVVGEDPVDLVMPEDLPEIPASLEEAMQLAISMNPALKTAEYRTESAEHDIAVNRAALFPEVSVRGNMSRENDSFSFGSSEFQRESITLNVAIPLYQSGAEYSRVRQAIQTRERRKFETSDTRDRLLEAVTQAWEQMVSNRASITSSEQAVKAAEIALEGVKQEHQFGARTTLDVLDAEQELFQSNVNLTRAQRDSIVSVYNLLATVGKLTPKEMGLDVETYDMNKHYNDVKYKIWGF